MTKRRIHCSVRAPSGVRSLISSVPGGEHTSGAAVDGVLSLQMRRHGVDLEFHLMWAQASA